MKNIRESGSDQALLNAALGDEDWQALSTSVKRKALAEMGAERRKRRLRLRVGQVACLAALLAGIGWWLRPSLPSHTEAALRPSSSAPAPVEHQFISEQQMLAMFPSGSCVLAEVDGQKELVFFDAQKAQEGFVVPRR
jgi:hypothetical protein